MNNLIITYQNKIKEWDMYPDSVKPTIYLLGEFGEIGELVDKIIDHYEKFNKIEKRQLEFALEFGDIYWYLFRFMNALGFSYDEIRKIKVEVKPKDFQTNLLRLYVELGKISNKLKKVFRDHGGLLESKQTVYAEKIAVVFKYLDLLLEEIGYTFEEVIQLNYEKLDSRFKRHKIKGEGDTR